MFYLPKIRTCVTAVIGFFLISSCQMGRSNFMSEEERRELEAAYDSIQTTYTSLMEGYQADKDTLPEQLGSLYREMEQMHRQMDISHRQMMARSSGRHMQGDRMMAKGMGMHMQNHMTGEWYRQMRGMHEQMAALHRKMGQQSMAEMNGKLSKEYDKMMRMVPGLDEPTEVPYNEKGDPSMLSGENLYLRNCASCHGNDGEGIAGAFPPLVDSKWITADKTVPIRILLHGLKGEIEVNGQTYSGSMPSFKARLSAAEIAAILNYLRQESEEGLPKIRQSDIINTGKKYRGRTTAWKVEDLE